MGEEAVDHRGFGEGEDPSDGDLERDGAVVPEIVGQIDGGLDARRAARVDPMLAFRAG